MATFGFIGTGNMGGALARAARKRLSGGEILLANRSAAKAEALAQELDCRAVDNAAVAAEADYIFLGVKPYMVAGLMEKNRGRSTDRLGEWHDRANKEYPKYHLFSWLSQPQSASGSE